MWRVGQQRIRATIGEFFSVCLYHIFGSGNQMETLFFCKNKDCHHTQLYTSRYPLSTRRTIMELPSLMLISSLSVCGANIGMILTRNGLFPYFSICRHQR